jgi:prepilin peptidase CpaA
LTEGEEAKEAAALWATTLWTEGSPGLQWGVVVCAALVAAWTDLASRRIYNWLTVPMAAGGLCYGAAVGGIAGMSESLAACVLVAIPYVLLFLFAQGGAGDAKMMGAVGAWLGLVNGLAALAAVSIAGIGLAFLFSWQQGRLKETTSNVSGLAYGMLYAAASRGRVGESLRSGAPSESTLTMPYGLAILVGVGIAATGVLLWRM